MSKVLVILEEELGSELSQSSMSALRSASYFSSKNNMELVVFIFGDCGEELSKFLGFFNISFTFFYPLSVYHQAKYVSILSSFVKEHSIDYIVSGASVHSYEYLPMLSGMLSCSIVTEVYSFDLSKEGNLLVKRAYYTGKLVEELLFSSVPVIISLAGGVFLSSGLDEESSRFRVMSPSLYEGVDNAKEIIFLLKKLSSVGDGGGSSDLMNASIIVSGGTGLEDASNFVLLEELALCLGASVGASRAVVDLGWRNYSEQVGQTGKIVSPLLYIACGIRGAIQHIVGIRQSKYIVAINKDEEAPIFNYSDIGIVGDVLEVLPVLIERLKSYKSFKCSETS